MTSSLRARGALIVGCLVTALALAGCATSSDAEADAPAEAPDTETTTTDPAGFCDLYPDHATLIGVIESPPSEAAEAVTTVVGLTPGFVATTPPEDIADEWGVLSEYFSEIAAHFADVDTDDDTALGDALEAMPERVNELAFAAADAAYTVGEFAAVECGTGDAAGTTVTDACTLLSEADAPLVAVMGGDVPEGESSDLGFGWIQCQWEAAASDNEVWVMLVPIDEFRSEYLDESTPLANSEIDELEDGAAYEGMIGTGSFSTSGHAVSFTAGDVGGFVSVRTGDGDSRAEDVGAATQLAIAVVGRL
ncbi:hypothetical protein ARHIZOSPH14_18810 [Agromyces rhizosphaerae]|uniref:DUF3558 domain-containing protein n=1 Tax=Agromyces rhizosphaerae TaxID=88374 RepID=A0A9W6CYJ4_9MICO|nr:hypothetical protein [Agromyces rhizosphaerae]GLI27639.1 hypothetical protein ARHIZOSPH14_18810 [Agromyces rhizosphaerae]